MNDFLRTVLIPVIAGGVAGLFSGTLVPALLQHRRWKRERQEKESARKAMVFEGGFYWRKDPDGVQEGPFCPQCLDSDGKLIRLRDHGNYYWGCYTCGNTYGSGPAAAPETRRRYDPFEW